MTFQRHRVRGNETLQGISIKYGVTIEEIKRINKIWNDNDIYTTKVLVIPVVVGFEDCQMAVEDCLDKMMKPKKDQLKIEIKASAPCNNVFPDTTSQYVHSMGDPMILYGKKSECPGFIEWIKSSWNKGIN